MCNVLRGGGGRLGIVKRDAEDVDDGEDNIEFEDDVDGDETEAGEALWLKTE